MILRKILFNLFLLLGISGFILGVSALDSMDTKTLLIFGLPTAFVLWAVFLYLELVLIPRRNARELRDAQAFGVMRNYAEADVRYTQAIYDQMQDEFDSDSVLISSPAIADER